VGLALGTIQPRAREKGPTRLYSALGNNTGVGDLHGRTRQWFRPTPEAMWAVARLQMVCGDVMAGPLPLPGSRYIVGFSEASISGHNTQANVQHLL
jgi:hypothetical protein